MDRPVLLSFSTEGLVGILSVSNTFGLDCSWAWRFHLLMGAGSYASLLSITLQAWCFPSSSFGRQPAMKSAWRGAEQMTALWRLIAGRRLFWSVGFGRQRPED